MREAVDKAGRGLEVEQFVAGLGREICVDASGALGAERGVEARARRHQFRSVGHLLAPAVVLSIREAFWNLMGRRVGALKLSTHQMREVLSRGTAFRAELKRYRDSDPQSVARANEREAAASSASSKTSRVA